MFICVYIYIYAYLCICIHTWIFMYIHIGGGVSRRAHRVGVEGLPNKSTWTGLHCCCQIIYLLLPNSLYICIYIFICIYMNIYLCVYLHKYIYLHKYTALFLQDVVFLHPWCHGDDIGHYTGSHIKCTGGLCCILLVF
jgi:hypothetical protein